MFDQELERLTVIIHARTIGSRGKITLREILVADIPSSIQYYFRLGVEEKFAREWKQTVSQSKFSYAPATMRTIKNELQSVLVLNYSFPRKEFLHSLDDGIHLMLNYLVRPQWTLRSFVFNNSEKISSTTMLEMLKGFSEYDYIVRIVERVVEETKMAQFTKTELELLLHNLDKEYFQRRTPREIVTIMKPIFRYFNCGSSVGVETIPVQAAQKFFEDKKMNSVAEQVQKNMDANNWDPVTEKDVQNILEHIFSTKGSLFAQNSPVASDAITPFQNKEEITPQEAESSEFDDALSSMAPTEEEVLALLKKPSSPIYFPLEEKNIPREEESVQIESSGDFSARDTKEQQHHGPLFETKQDVERKEENVITSRKDIRSTMSERMQKKFTKKIFRRSEAEYQKAIDTLNAMQSWNEARLYIGDIFIHNEIDPYSSAAAKFTDVIHSWFRT
ncbi:MAG: hypothetical protein FJ218_03880 [Ignavibacteria bacterium]|nr:hypothetical protein [Ignavibacteria bacterium]